MIPVILDHAGALLSRYDVLFCDVWGVLHDGRHAYSGANDALPRFRTNGGIVVLVSNAPLPGEAVARVLDQKGVTREAWDAIVSSGDLTRLRLAALNFNAVHHVGPTRDLPLFNGAPINLVDLPSAQALVVTGLIDDVRETAEDYTQLLQSALARSLPLICANPDLSVEVGGKIYPCAGAIAALYEGMGGQVHWEGKPHRGAYDEAFKAAARMKSTSIERKHVLAIGDAVRTDLAGAAQNGIDALFVAGGLHRDQVMCEGKIMSDRLVDLLADKAATTIAATPFLMW